MSARRYERCVRALAAFLLVAGLMLVSPVPRARSAAGPAARPVGPTVAITPAAAAALRAGDCDTARQLAAAATSESSESTVVVGLLSLHCGAAREARERFLVAAGGAGGFEDWRLYGLARATAELDADSHAALTTRQVLTAVDQLLASHPDSPLVPAALRIAAQVAARTPEPGFALDRIDAAWLASVGGEERELLGELAWKVARASGTRPPAERVARRLLIEAPLLAAELEVVETFRQPDGRVPWNEIFDAGELEDRAARLAGAGLNKNAIATLDEVPGESRGASWGLLYVEALVDSHRGVEALEQLKRLAPTWHGEAGGEAEWLAARAALDAAELRRGRRNLSADGREKMRTRALALLSSVAGRAPADDRSRRARELLVAELVEEGDREGVVTTARELAAADPGNRAAATALWRLGWKRFEEDDFETALAIWGELDDLTPTSDLWRAARYWSARAWQKLDEPARAQSLFAELAAPGPADFYHRQAAARAGTVAAQAAPEPPAVEPWPTDPRLDRATRLSLSGLDELALLELGALDPTVDPRARAALRAQVLARRGEPRESIRAIRRAFLQLGTAGQESAPAEALRLYYPLEFAGVIRAEARDRELPPTLVLAIIRQESAFDATARSSAGARGLMQLMPATGRELAGRLGMRFTSTRLGEPEVSVRLGTTYFRQVLEMFDRSEELALAGYNAGPYRIRRLWRQAGDSAELDRFLEGLPIAETRSYVKRVLLFADSYERLYG